MSYMPLTSPTKSYNSQKLALAANELIWLAACKVAWCNPSQLHVIS